MIERFAAGTIALALLSALIPAHAQLTAVTKNGGRMVSDATLNVTWADVASPIYLTWSATGDPGSAQAWVASLNAQAYGGFKDWTLPTGDGKFTADHGSRNDVGIGVSTSKTANQLAYLFINELKNTPLSMATKFGPFTALSKNQVYWSGTLFTGAAGSAWAFDNRKGYQVNHNMGRRFRAIAVRPGRVAAD
jgi:hypothetical protein